MKTFQTFSSGKLALACLLVSAITTASYAQKPDRKTTLSYINKKLAPICIVDMRAGNFIAIYNDADGNKIREDKVPAFDLDTAVIYDPIEKILSVNCTGGSKDCVMRSLIKQKVRRGYARISFVVNDETQVESLRKALIHLIRIDSQFRYTDEITFE
ncbi:MAG: hypothetical protein ABI772_08615 [Bacteroidota bacterium]